MAIINKEILPWLLLADKLKELNISINDIASIEIGKDNNWKIILNESMKVAEMTVIIKEQ